MKKCCFIIPYFGNFPSSFPFFLKSCENNEDYDWLIFTDDVSAYNYPKNVNVIIESVDVFIKRIESKLKLKTNITETHKLCDFKPAYGLICEEYLENYKCWGFCDIDLIFGKLDHFITDEMIEKYDKMFLLGHFQIFKNNKANNRVFMSLVDDSYWYRESFTKSETTVFDEVGAGIKNINTLFTINNKNIFQEDYSMNTMIAPANFVRTKYNSNLQYFIREKFKLALYIWCGWGVEQNEGLFRYYMKDGKIYKEEFMYMHFQQRDMQIHCDLNSYKIKILGNGFYDLTYSDINEITFSKERKLILSLRYLLIIGKWKFNGLRKKIMILK